MKPMTASEFEKKTERPPENDDLDRVNCHLVGWPGHRDYGWCSDCDTPRFDCRCEPPERLPRPGDAVRIMVDKPGVQAGSIAVLEGRVRDLAPKDVSEVCFGFRPAYRDPYQEHPEYVKATGGPSWYISPLDLTPTYETYEMPFWRDKDKFPRAGNGIAYTLTVPIWEYTPTEEGRQFVQDWIEAGQKRSES
jgi:hypothetical protein